MIKTLTTLIILSFFISCNSNKTFKYIVTEKVAGVLSSYQKEKEPIIIKASSDSAAYLEAYRNFCISQKTNKDMLEALGSVGSTPVSFKLLDEKGNDIANTIFFVNKDSLEKAIHLDFFSMPNGIKESVDKIKTEKAGAISKSNLDTVQIKNLQKYFNIKTDEFDPNGKKWYKPKSSPKYVNINAIYCYFQVENDVPSNFRFCFQYYSDEWLFIKMCQFSIDGKAYEYYPAKVNTDSGNGGYIWEWFDDNVSSSDLNLIEALANAQAAKVKLIGRQYYNIKTITKDQITNIKRSLDLYKAMGGKF